MLPGAHAIQEIRMAGSRGGKLIQEFLDVGNGAFEALVHLSVGAFDIRHLAGSLKSFAFQDDPTAIGISISDFAPDAHGVGVLHGSVHLHLYGIGVVLT